MIDINHFSKQFPSGFGNRGPIRHAVTDLSLTAMPGEIVGLLGPNGAGKTTTLRCIATLMKPSQGTISVHGCDTVLQEDAVRKSLSFLTNDLKMDDHFTPRQTLDLFGRLHQLDRAAFERQQQHLVDLFGLEEYLDTRIRKLSTGTRQKLSIAVSLIHDPQVIVFDEPTNALDIPTTRHVVNYLKELRAKNRTVLISTHLIDVAEKLCDRIAILLEGRLQALGTQAELLADTGTGSLEEAFFHYYDRQGGAV